MLIDDLLRPPHWWLLNVEGDGGDGGGDNPNDNEPPPEDPVDRLAAEGDELPLDEEQESTKEPEDEEDPTLTALKDEIADLRAERTFWRGEAAKSRTEPTPVAQPATKDVVQEVVDGLDMADLARRVTDKDPNVGIKAVVDIVKQVAKAVVADGLKDARGYVDESQAQRSIKEADLSSTMADFEDEFARYGQPFIDQVGVLFNEAVRDNGGKYTRKAMWNAAAAAKVQFDRRAAQTRGSRNGVTPVRPNSQPANRVESTTTDFSKIKTIAAIPDNLMSAREKAAARRVAQQLNVPEKEWVANFFAERADNPNYGV